jgi:hypothetical protein
VNTIVPPRLRATLVIGLAWGLAWLPPGLLLALQADSRPPQPSDFISRPVSVPLFVTAWSLWGALSGCAFAALLSMANRRRSIETVSRLRTAAWGALGALALPLTLVVIDRTRTPPGLLGEDWWRFVAVVLTVSGGLGAVCATATLALARRERSSLRQARRVRYDR